MKTIHEHRQSLLAQLIEHSNKIDMLVVKSKQTVEGSLAIERELKHLRTQQQSITEKLHRLEQPISNIWENIGNGG